MKVFRTSIMALVFLGLFAAPLGAQAMSSREPTDTSAWQCSPDGNVCVRIHYDRDCDGYAWTHVDFKVQEPLHVSAWRLGPTRGNWTNPAALESALLVMELNLEMATLQSFDPGYAFHFVIDEPSQCGPAT